MGRVYTLGLDEQDWAFLGLVLSMVAIGITPLVALEHLDESRLLILIRALPLSCGQRADRSGHAHVETRPVRQWPPRCGRSRHPGGGGRSQFRPALPSGSGETRRRAAPVRCSMRDTRHLEGPVPARFLGGQAIGPLPVQCHNSGTWHLRTPHRHA